jgi:hypothetical protein
MAMQSRIWACLFVFASVFSFSQVSLGSETDQDVAGFHDLPVNTSFTGEVSFEPRYTRVHDDDCSGHPWQKSQKYWGLVVVSEGHRYVFDRKLSLGEDLPPQSVELAGRILKSGSIVKVRGQVATGGLEYYIILDIESIKVLAESEWICHSTGDQSPNINVRVWYDLLKGEGVRKIYVEESRDLNIYPIVTVNSGTVSSGANELLYSGLSRYVGRSIRESKIELRIQKGANQTSDLESFLKIETVAHDHDQIPWVSTVIPLKCSQATLSIGD